MADSNTEESTKPAEEVTKTKPDEEETEENAKVFLCLPANYCMNKSYLYYRVVLIHPFISLMLLFGHTFY